MRRFVMIPWELYVRYDLDPVAREEYGILRGRWDLSLQDADTGRDERGMYCVYPRDELRGVIGCSEPTLRRALRYLQESGLLEIRRAGRGQPYRLYINRTIREQYEDMGKVLPLR